MSRLAFDSTIANLSSNDDEVAVCVERRPSTIQLSSSPTTSSFYKFIFRSFVSKHHFTSLSLPSSSFLFLIEFFCWPFFSFAAWKQQKMIRTSSERQWNGFILLFLRFQSIHARWFCRLIDTFNTNSNNTHTHTHSNTVRCVRIDFCKSASGGISSAVAAEVESLCCQP